MHNTQAIAAYPLDPRIHKVAFAITIRDLSMAPQFMPGEVVIIDPEVLPVGDNEDPDFVLARVNKTGRFVFRLYREREAGAFDLVGLHKDARTISSTPDDPVILLGTMIEHRRKRRR